MWCRACCAIGPSASSCAPATGRRCACRAALPSPPFPSPLRALSAHPMSMCVAHALLLGQYGPLLDCGDVRPRRLAVVGGLLRPGAQARGGHRVQHAAGAQAPLRAHVQHLDRHLRGPRTRGRWGGRPLRIGNIATSHASHGLSRTVHSISMDFALYLVPAFAARSRGSIRELV
jgi:hypothetical protein